MTQWSLTVSDNTDKRLRAFLGQNGTGNIDISHFVEGAVERLLRFEETVNNVQSRNINYSEADIMADIDEAIKASRATHSH